MSSIKLLTDSVNLVFTTDWHLSDKPPGRRQDDYRRAILDKLEFVRDLTEKVKGIALCGGDCFHIKNPKSSANSFSLLVEILHALRRFPTNGVWGTVGNHDLSYDNMSTLPSQPLGLLIAAGVYRNLVGVPEVFSNRDDSIRVQVETFPYADGDTTLKRLLATGPRPEGITSRIGIVHAYGQPGNGGNMFGERTIGYSELEDLDFDFLLWGHDHSRHETKCVGKTTHINLGSLARAAFPSDEVERPVVAVIISLTPDAVSYREESIPVKPLEIAFTVADKGVENVSKSDDVTEFFAKMDVAVDGIESSDPREVLTQLCPDDKMLVDLVIQLCEL
jgi:DNA repair exonuclease SbcCD nuclease subunit